MIVAFRVDSSTEIGSGHVMRCLALAEAVRERGAVVQFLCRDHEGNLIDLIGSRGFSVVAMTAPQPRRDPAWGMLGVPVEQDTRETLDALPDGTTWLVVDHYGLDSAWESRMRDRSEGILVMDDLADRRHECDVLIDPTFPGESSRYDELVPSHARLLLGPRYAQMGAEYAEAAALRADVGQKAPRILVFYGGTDRPNLTGRTLRAVSREGLRDIPADVVVGATNPHRHEVEALARNRPNTTVHGPQPALADLMAECTIAAGAGGVTLWERLCLGLPGIVVSLADNQRASCQGLSAAGLITYLGPIDSATEDAMAGALHSLLDERATTATIVDRGQAIVDGLGAMRAAEVMLPTPANRLIVRPAVAADRGRYFVWANDPTVRSSALSTQEISWPDHSSWFADRLARDECHLFVLEADGLPVGQARFEIADGVAALDYSIDELVRGRAWGQVLLTLAIAALRESASEDIVAQVRAGNTASVSTLEHAGFRPSGDVGRHPDVIRLRLQSGHDGVADDADLIVGQ